MKEKEQEEHILLTASTGGGKSTLEIIPNLLRETGSRSLFIADLKIELYRFTAGTLPGVILSGGLRRYAPTSAMVSFPFSSSSKAVSIE